MTGHGVPIVRGARGKGPRSRRAKQLKAHASRTAVASKRYLRHGETTP